MAGSTAITNKHSFQKINKKLLGTVKFLEQKASHFYCQVCRCNISTYFKHVNKFEHKNAWKDPRNKNYYDKLDEILNGVSVDHFEEIKQKQVINEEKENQSLNSDLLTSAQNSRVLNVKLYANGDSADMASFPTGSEPLDFFKGKSTRRVLKRIDNPSIYYENEKV